MPAEVSSEARLEPPQTAGRRPRPAPRESVSNEGSERHGPLRDQAPPVGSGAVPRGDACHVPDLLPDPGRPGPAGGRQVGHARRGQGGRAQALPRPAGLYAQYLHFLDQLVVHRSLGYSFNNRQSVNSSDLRGRPRDRLARARRRVRVDADRRSGRRPLGAAAAVDPRPLRHGRRAGRHLGASRCSDRPTSASYIFGYKLGISLPDPGLLQLHAGRAPGQICGGPWRLVHAHAHAVARVRRAATPRSTCA